MTIKNLKWNPPAGGNAGYWSGTFIVDNTGDSIDTFRLPIGNTTGDITVKLDGIDENLFPGAEKSINVIDCYSFNLTSSSPTVTEGGTVTLNLTTDAPDGDYAFNITELESTDLDVSAGSDVSWDGTSKYTGVFTKSGGTVTSITLNVLTDADTSSEDFTVQLDNGKADPIIVTINEPAPPAVCGSQIAPWSNQQSNSIMTDGTTTPIDIGNYAVKLFDNGGTLYLPEIDPNAQPAAFVFHFKNPANGQRGIITSTGSSLTPDFYYEFGGVCYKGSFNTYTGSSGNPQDLDIV